MTRAAAPLKVLRRVLALAPPSSPLRCTLRSIATTSTPTADEAFASEENRLAAAFASDTAELASRLHAEAMRYAAAHDTSATIRGERIGDHFYFSETRDGDNLPRFCRMPSATSSHSPSTSAPDAEVLVDLPALAERHGYAGLRDMNES